MLIRTKTGSCSLQNTNSKFIVKKLNREGHPVRYLISDLFAQAFN